MAAAPFSIVIEILWGLSPSQTAILETAVQRCRQTITGVPGAAAAQTGLHVEVMTGEVPAGQNAETTLVQSWPGSGLPSRAELRLAADALTTLENDGRLGEIFLHELFHCLGFGLAWTPGLLDNDPADGPIFRGPRATAEYQALLAQAGRNTNVHGVPIENAGVAGQSGRHWRETVFDTELMSTRQPSAGNPLSRLSIASLADLGYSVGYGAAQPYELPG